MRSPAIPWCWSTALVRASLCFRRYLVPTIATPWRRPTPNVRARPGLRCYPIALAATPFCLSLPLGVGRYPIARATGVRRTRRGSDSGGGIAKAGHGQARCAVSVGKGSYQASTATDPAQSYWQAQQPAQQASPQALQAQYQPYSPSAPRGLAGPRARGAGAVAAPSVTSADAP